MPLRFAGRFGAGMAGALVAALGLWLSSARAADAPAPPASPTRLILLGTGGGPIVRKQRAQPASLLIVKGKSYLIDAGDGVNRQLAMAGLQAADLRAVFITHHHLDHNAGLPALIGFNWFQGNQRGSKAPPLQIHGPPATGRLVQASLDYLGTAERILRAGTDMTPAAGRFAAHDIGRDGVVYQDADVKVTAVRNSHFDLTPSHGPATGPDRSYAYRFDTADRSVVFTGDTGPSDAVAALAKGADVLVAEVQDLDAVMRFNAALPHPPQQLEKLRDSFARAHLTPEAVGRLATAAGVKAVMLTHFIPGLDAETDAARYLAGVRKYYSGPVIAGRDLIEY